MVFSVTIIGFLRQRGKDYILSIPCPIRPNGELTAYYWGTVALLLTTIYHNGVLHA